ncbi:MAG: alpha/beta hydrolase-fold protein [Terracidiphilus sp.]|jgi:predicted esterase
MPRISRFLAACLSLAWVLAPSAPRAVAAKPRQAHPEPPQETGFLNRKVELHGATYRFQVYLPEDWRRDDHKPWPIILALHGRGERGSEGMWQTQIGLPQAVRDHPERWPFIIVMPQCPQVNYWTDPEMLAMATAALDQESAEFHADPERTYLTGISLGGYGAWELARLDPHRWAAIAIISSGIFWSYAPERWQQASTLPEEYARALGRTPVWLFHGTDDNVVPPRESELMYDALRTAGGRVRLWLFQGLKHDTWTRAYLEPDLPRWLLAHRAEATESAAEKSSSQGSRPSSAPGLPAIPEPEPPAFAERRVIPLHPPAIKLSIAALDALTGEYHDRNGRPEITIFRQGDQLYEKSRVGEIDEMAPETPSVFFYPNGSSLVRLTFDRDPQGRITALVYRDDRHEERWEKHTQSASR